MHKAAFTIEEHPKAYIGYASPLKWKMWERPFFELDVAKEIAEDFKYDEHPMSYDEGTDTFKIWYEGNGRYNEIKGEECQTEDGIKILYGIGEGNWLWNSPNERNLYCLAEGIEDFLWEFDTYAYWDCFGIEWNRESVVEVIKNQLKELKTFQQVYEIWHNEDLSQDERFDKLSKLLTV